MKNRLISFCSWRWGALALVGIAAALLLLCGIPENTVAQEQTPTATSPNQAQTATGPAETPAKPEAPKPPPSAAKELSNQSCYDCHNPDILKLSKDELADQVVVGEKPLPKTRPPYVFGDLSLSIDEKKYASGVHADTTCVTCHSDVKDIPHAQRLKKVECAECHEESVENIKTSAHGEKGGDEKRAPKITPCIGCHDVHQGKGQSAYAEDFKRKVCIDCHKAYGMDTLKGHEKLYEAKLHLRMDCMLCHQGKEPGVHNIPLVKTKVAGCESCHTKYTVLSKTKPQHLGTISYMTQTGFINREALKQYGYVLGAHRIPGLDTLLILVVLGTLGLPIVHGGLRVMTRRKGPIDLPEEKIYLHPLPERIWHWFQALCIIVLVITGIMLHWPEKFPGWFEWSVTTHNWFGILVLLAWVFWLVYNVATGRFTHYIPKKGEIPKGMVVQAKFYGYGIFKHEPHPYAPTEDNKFNPLQKIAYLKFQLFLFPLLLISGVLYMWPEAFRGVISLMGGMTVLALIHYILGAIFAAFLLAHLYLATTGETVSENFKAIITGWGIKEDEHKHV